MTEFTPGKAYKCISAKSNIFTEGCVYQCFAGTGMYAGKSTPYLVGKGEFKVDSCFIESDFIEVDETVITDNQRVFDLLEYVSRGVELGVDQLVIDNLLETIRDEVRSQCLEN